MHFHQTELINSKGESTTLVVASGRNLWRPEIYRKKAGKNEETRSAEF